MELELSDVEDFLSKVGTKRFTVWFIKQDGSLRKMICNRRQSPPSHTNNPELVTVKELRSGVRCFNKHLVRRLRSGKLTKP